MEYTQKPVSCSEGLKFLKYSAKLHGKTVAEFCAFVGISRVTPWRWKKKKFNPDHITLSRIQRANDLLKDCPY